MSASALISSVLASPGTPVMRQCPPVKSAISTCSTTSSCPTMTFLSSLRIRSRPSATFSALTVATDGSMSNPCLVGEGVDDLVDGHALRQAGVLDVAGVALGVRPFPAVAHVGVEVDEHHRPAVVVEDGAKVRHHAALLPRAAGEERAETGDLRVGIELVEGAEHRMIPGHLDDLAIREEALHLALERIPLELTVEVVHHREAAAQQELAQDRQLGLGHAHAARLDEVDPRVLEPGRVGEREEEALRPEHSAVRAA